jgi:uncharacterized membrane-anchored protein
MKNRLYFLFMAALTLATIYREKLQKLLLIVAAILCVLGLIYMPAIGHAEEQKPLDIFHCAKLAEQFSKGPTSLPVADLDELALCVGWVMNRKIQEPQEEREARAIERNFARPAK